ncbi:MAG: serine/threonine protein kinase [Pedosphaera sp.]|nr:serine/threonine protein kinase [Pedosphaera sp.]
MKHAICPQIGVVLFTFGLLVSNLGTADDNWPRFRGADATGVASDDPRLPVEWSKTNNVVWTTDIPGLGWSSPVVWGNRVFLTTVVSDKDDANVKPKKGLYLGEGRREVPQGVHRWLTCCLDLRTGKVLWTKEAHQGLPKVTRHPKSTYASETPATDGERLYVLFGDLGLYCYDLDGQPLWSQPIEPKKTMADYGAAGSPIVHEGQVIVIYDNQEESFIASFDARTGKQRWRAAREEKSTWATPFVWKHSHRAEIVTPGKNRIRSYDLDGKLLWEMNGRMSNLIIPSPFAAHGMLYVTSGYVGDPHRPVYAIKPGATGDISLAEGQTTNEFIAWYLPKGGPYNPSAMVHGDYYYTLLDRGMIMAHDARTGRVVYDLQRFPVGASFTSSPWAYNGRVFCLAEDGRTFVVSAGPEFKVERVNDLDDLCLATPAISQGNLLIRTASKLYCIAKGPN